MRSLRLSFASLLLTLAPAGLHAVSTGNPFYGDAPDERHPWAVHDRNRPQPKPVTPAPSDQPGRPPSDAIVLFDGTEKSLALWRADTKEGGPTAWIVRDGAFECVPKSGYTRTREEFGDCQLHVEWAAPSPAELNKESQARGNSGIFLMGLVEVQVLDNYENPTYADGFAASVYGVNPPLANALRAPGQFQSIDIVFRRPLYQGDKLIDPGYVTVFCNGVLVQDHTPLEGPTGHMKRTAPKAFPAVGPLKLQDHGNPVRFRNIWYRPLPPRSLEGGTDGVLTAEATRAKRAAIAATLRSEAAALPAGSVAQGLRLAESLVYATDARARDQVEHWAQAYAAEIKGLPTGALEGRKDEVKSVIAAFKYLAKNQIFAANFAPKTTLEQVSKQAGWDDEKKK